MNKQTYRISTNRLPPPVGWGVEGKLILRAFLKKINSKFWSNVSPQLNAASFRHSCQLSPVSCALGELTDRESISIYYRNHDQTLRWRSLNLQKHFCRITNIMMPWLPPAVGWPSSHKWGRKVEFVRIWFSSVDNISPFCCHLILPLPPLKSCVATNISYSSNKPPVRSCQQFIKDRSQNAPS